MKTRSILTLLCTFAILIAASTAWAGPTPGSETNYQGLLLDPATGEPVPDGQYQMSLSMYDAPNGGILLASHTFPNVPVTDGRFVLQHDFQVDSFFDVFFEVEVEGLVLAPRQPITAAPRAQTAANAESATNGQFFVNDPTGGPSQILFGPTGFDPDPDNNCAIGVFPGLPGLTETDPNGFRLLGPGGEGCRLIFGPTEDCTIEVDPISGPPGLLFYDIFGFRFCRPPLNPDGPTRVLFGPTDDCSLSINEPDPINPGAILPGLTERDPTGFRLLGQDSQGCRLIFGPTMDCTVEVDPAGPPGLLLRDPNSIRLINPLGGPPTLIFGPTDDCRMEAGGPPAVFPPGLRMYDPDAIRFCPIPGLLPPPLVFGDDPDNLCRIQAEPGVGLRLNDPGGLIVSNIGSSGKDGVRNILMGPTLDVGECRWQVNPALTGPTGMILYDPFGLRICVDDPAANIPTVRFGETDDCRVEGDPDNGMCFSDPRGFKFFGGNVEVAGNLCVTGEIFGTVNPGPCPSDIRFKQNVTVFSNALDAIENVRGVRYDWNREEFPEKNFSEDRQIGVIAQEVKEVLPEVVTIDEDGFHYVDYTRLSAVLIEAVKELNDRETATSKELATLRSENQELRNQLASIQDQMTELTALASKLAAAQKHAAADIEFTGGE